MIPSMRVNPLLPPTAVAAKAAELLRRAVKDRTGLELPDAQAGPPGIELDIDGAVGPEAYRIEPAGGAVRVVGGDDRGLLYGAGKLLRGSRFDKGLFQPAGPMTAADVSSPRRQVRGMYFATHFHNFYHDAPIEEVCRYVEELAMWGCNVLSVWFDMHHFDGIDDPAAAAMIGRLRRILKAGGAVGMAPCLVLLANEGYNNSPQHLRADWTAGHDGYFAPPGGHYHREICPSKPGGLENILATRRGMFEAFADLDVRWVWLWPYDQGGCTCSQCAPWGVNGFLRTAEPVGRLAREFWPAAKVILSTWYFDRFIKGEWEGLAKAFASGPPDWVDYLLADDWGGFPQYPVKFGSPGGLPIVSFPEISMEHMFPWGGFGANPRPAHWQAYADTTRDLLAGGFPYSEGIFEDINKVVSLQLNWEPSRGVRDIVHEYASYEYGPAVAADVVQACLMLEESMCHSPSEQVRKCVAAKGAGQPGARAEMPEIIYNLPRLRDPKRCFSLLQSIHDRLGDYTRRSWRWRILWLRGALDLELHNSGGRATEKSEEYLAELTAIYHAEGAEEPVAPLSLRYIARRK